MQWKNDLIASFESRAAAAAIAVPAADAGLDDVEFRRLALVGTFQHDKEVFLTGRTYEGNAGFHIVTPFQLDDGRVILINRGWVSEGYRDPEKRKFSLIKDNIVLKGIIRYPQKKGYFVPENDGKQGFWFTIKPSQIFNFLELRFDNFITSYYIDALRQGKKLTLPIGVSGNPKLRNQHLSYAITWYGLALSLLFVYFSYHVSVGRLHFKKKVYHAKSD